MFQILIGLLFAGLIACAAPPKRPDVDAKAAPEAIPGTKPLKKSMKVTKKEKLNLKKKVATTTPTKKPAIKVDEDLSAVETKYSAAKSVSMVVKKSLILSLLERTDTFDGRFFLSGKEKLRLEFDKPIKSVAVLNGQEFWIIEYPPADVEDKVRVLKSTLGEKSQSQVLVTSLLGRGHLQESFKVESKEKKNSQIIFKLLPLSEMTDVKNLRVVVDEEKKLIVEVTYEDELENKTKFEFSKIEFDGDFPEKIFTFAPPKGAEISHL